MTESSQPNNFLEKLSLPSFIKQTKEEQDDQEYLDERDCELEFKAVEMVLNGIGNTGLRLA